MIFINKDISYFIRKMMKFYLYKFFNNFHLVHLFFGILSTDIERCVCACPCLARWCELGLLRCLVLPGPGRLAAPSSGDSLCLVLFLFLVLALPVLVGGPPPLPLPRARAGKPACWRQASVEAGGAEPNRGAGVLGRGCGVGHQRAAARCGR